MKENLQQLRLELIKLCDSHAYEAKVAIEKAKEYEAYILGSSSKVSPPKGTRQNR